MGATQQHEAAAPERCGCGGEGFKYHGGQWLCRECWAAFEQDMAAIEAVNSEWSMEL